jgi:hypothetical protein
MKNPPPPKPAVKESTINTQNGVVVFITASPMPTAGIILIIVAMLITCRDP